MILVTYMILHVTIWGDSINSIIAGIITTAIIFMALIYLIEYILTGGELWWPIEWYLEISGSIWVCVRSIIIFSILAVYITACKMLTIEPKRAISEMNDMMQEFNRSNKIYSEDKSVTEPVNDKEGDSEQVKEEVENNDTSNLTAGCSVEG